MKNLSAEGNGSRPGARRRGWRRRRRRRLAKRAGDAFLDFGIAIARAIRRWFQTSGATTLQAAFLLPALVAGFAMNRKRIVAGARGAKVVLPFCIVTDPVAAGGNDSQLIFNSGTKANVLLAIVARLASPQAAFDPAGKEFLAHFPDPVAVGVGLEGIVIVGTIIREVGDAVAIAVLGARIVGRRQEKLAAAGPRAQTKQHDHFQESSLHSFTPFPHSAGIEKFYPQKLTFTNAFSALKMEFCAGEGLGCP